MISNTRTLLGISLITVALALGSCVSDRDIPASDRGEMSLRISFDPGSTTRADIPAESRIDKVAVLLCTEDDETVPGVLYECVEARNLTPGSGGYHFDATLSLDDADIPERLVALLLCNVDAERIRPFAGKPITEIADLLVESFSVGKCAELTMSGRCTPVVNTRLASQQLSATVTRDRARVDVDASAVGESVFSLSDIYVYRHNDLVSVFPYLRSLPFVPVSATKKSSGHFNVSPDGNTVMEQVYIPETDVVMGGDGNPADSKRLERTALVVGGFYMGSPAKSYYRVDFTGSDGLLTDIIRNHRYVVNITGVNGPGSETPDIAYSSVTAGITATVIDWDRSDQYIVFDGVHWLSVESRSLVVGPDAGNYALLPVASDIPADKWRLAWTEDGDFGLPEAFEDAAVLDGKYFRVKCPEGEIANGGSLVFETLSPLPAGLSERSELLHIMASDRLHLWIRVTQCDIGSSPWTDGGEIKGTEIFE